METIKTWIKNAFIAFSVIVVFLMIMIFPKASAAVVVTDISATEFNSLISTHDAAWSVLYRGGGTSGAGSEEIRLTRYRDEGNQTLIGDLTWSASNNVLEVLIDEDGYLSARANITTVTNPEFAVIRPFNQILIRVYDEALFGSASDLQNIEINGHEVRNMFADGNGFPGDNDIVSIHDFGPQSPFSLNGVWSPGTGLTGDHQFVHIIALQNPVIPEPSTFFLVGLTSLFLFRRKR